MQINWLDCISVLWFILCWIGYGMYAKKQSFATDCLARILHDYRKKWAIQIINREIRTPDIILISSQERTSAFFASSSLLILAALFTAFSATDKTVGFLRNLPFTREISYMAWESMLVGLITIFIYAFFKISWSMRQYSFGLTIIGSLPAHNTDLDENEKASIVSPIAKTLSSAAYHFNCGLRAYYFSLAIVAWLFNTYFFIIATTFVVFELYRREFRSRVLRNMLPEK